MKSCHLSLCVCLALLTAGCHRTAPPPEVESIRIAGAGVGYGSFVDVATWLADSLHVPDGPTIWFDYYRTATAFRDGVLLLAGRQADIALVNSQGVAAMAMRGRGVFTQPIPLRAIAALPQDDWCLLAVDAGLGVATLADVRERKMPLKIATGYTGEVVVFLLYEVLRRHGIDPDEFKAWGGELIEGTPRENRVDVASGRANAVFQEGGYSDSWNQIAAEKPLSFISLEPQVASGIEEEFGWPASTVPANRYPGQTEPLLALDFSDWLLCVLEDTPDDTAHRLAEIVLETGYLLENDGLNLPFDRAALTQTSIPQHPGAARYFKEQGIR